MQAKVYESTGVEKERLIQELNRVKKEVYTDERKVEQRRKNFDQAKSNVPKRTLAEFLWLINNY